MLKALMALAVAMASTVTRCDALPSRRMSTGTDSQEGEDLAMRATETTGSGARRGAKALQFYVEAPQQGAFLLDLDDELEAALAASRYQMEMEDSDDNEIASRARPGRPKPDSPIYYVRLPPSPYMFVPGVGYVSQPPSIRPPPVRTAPDSPFVDLPLQFVSNAKPTGVYSWSAPAHVPQRPPQPQPPRRQSPITTLDKGPYLFNGRPTDIFLLRSAYDSLYADALQNFYP